MKVGTHARWCETATSRQGAVRDEQTRHNASTGNNVPICLAALVVGLLIGRLSAQYTRRGHKVRSEDQRAWCYEVYGLGRQIEDAERWNMVFSARDLPDKPLRTEILDAGCDRCLMLQLGIMCDCGNVKKEVGWQMMLVNHTTRKAVMQESTMHRMNEQHGPKIMLENL